MGKAVCFIGHRDTEDTAEMRATIIDLLINLIIQEDATDFLFGSRSTFNDICYEIVTQLTDRFPQIKRVAYPCQHEYAVLQCNVESKETVWSKIAGHTFKVNGYDEIRLFTSRCCAGKASYVQRNRAMIDDSDVCVFYCRTASGTGGTAVAYRYAVRQGKVLANLYVQAGS